MTLKQSNLLRAGEFLRDICCDLFDRREIELGQRGSVAELLTLAQILPRAPRRMLAPESRLHRYHCAFSSDEFIELRAVQRWHRLSEGRETRANDFGIFGTDLRI